MRYKVFDPALTIKPGETIVVETINHMTPIVWTEKDLHPHGSPEYREREETGPIAVRGAKPGDMLAIHIDKIEIVGLPHAHGSGPLVEKFPQKPIVFPVRDDRCIFPSGLSVPLSPMIGDIYTTPLSPTIGFPEKSFDHGGNMDFTEIKPGNTLYLPVFHDGGLLVLGDVHSVQGDGEMFGEGGETAADVTLTIGIDRKYKCPRPLVETKDSLICLAGRGNLFDSIVLGVEDATSLLSRLYSISEDDAYILVATIGSIRMGACMRSMNFAENRILIGISVPKDIRKTQA